MESLFGEYNCIRPRTEVEGTGSSLVICKEYAELLGGRIDMFSEAARGTRFEVRLPRSAEAVATLPLGTLPAPESLAA